jgi:ABC-type Na+ efflux pump permease subunit
MRYGFMAAGLAGALVLLVMYSMQVDPAAYVDGQSYDPRYNVLTVYHNDGQPPETRLVAPDAAVTLDGEPVTLSRLRGRFAVTANAGAGAAPGVVSTPGVKSNQPWISIAATEIGRRVSVKEARTFLLGMVIVEFAVILLIVTNAAASTVTREKEDGTLDLLLTTPITSRYYIWGKLRGLVSFVLPLVAVPVLSALCFIAYDLVRRVSNFADLNFEWVVFPEAVLIMPAVLVIVAAFAAIVGMQMSLRCRTTVMAVMSSVGVVVGLCAVMGWCGYKLLESSSNEFGLVIGSFSPFTILTLLIDPYTFAADIFKSGTLAVDQLTERTIVFVFSWIAVGAYAAVVWSMYRSMVKNFDMTIRRQSR